MKPVPLPKSTKYCQEEDYDDQDVYKEEIASDDEEKVAYCYYLMMLIFLV
jgi:hypothetical protein